MIYRFLIGVSLLGGIYLFARQIRYTEPMVLARIMLYIFAGVIVCIIGFLIFEHQYGPAIIMAASIFPGIAAWQVVRAVFRASEENARRAAAAIHHDEGASEAKPKPKLNQGDPVSHIQTRFLRMAMNHETGEVSGHVVRGLFRGQALSALKLPDQMALLAECRAGDPQSAAVLETYLDRRFPNQWRVLEAGPLGPESMGGANLEPEPPAMEPAEAYGILGLQPGASTESIREAHRRLIMSVHPDRGGSHYLAAKINQARDALLNA